jgi:hypothetical protein
MLKDFPNNDLSFSYRFMREIHRIKELEYILHPSTFQLIHSEEELKNNNTFEEENKIMKKIQINKKDKKMHQNIMEKLNETIIKRDNEIDHLKNIINEKDKELDNIKNTLYIFQLIN